MQKIELINMTWKEEIRKTPSKKIERFGAEYLKGVNSDVFEEKVLNEIQSLKEGLEHHTEELGSVTDWHTEEDEGNANQIIDSYKFLIEDLEKMKVSVNKIVKKLEMVEDDYEDLYHAWMRGSRKKPPHY